MSEEVGGDDDVELPRVEHQLHGAGVHDSLVDFQLARVRLAYLERGLPKDAGQSLEDVCLVHHGDLAPLVPDGVVEGEFGDPAAFGARVDARGDRHRLRVIADSEVVLPGDVQPFQVLTHQHDVDVLVASAGDKRARRPQVGIEAELFA